MSKTITVQNLNTSAIFLAGLTAGQTDGNVSVEIITMRPNLNMDFKKISTSMINKLNSHYFLTVITYVRRAYIHTLHKHA